MTFVYNGSEKEIPEINCWYPQTIVYDPIKAGSIDGTDIEPHDAAIVRAINSSYKPSYKAEGNPLHTLFVGRLSLDTRENDLEKAFSRYGKLVSVRLVKDIVTGLSKKYAFIEYETSKITLNAYLRCKSLVINNSEVFVDFECGRLLPGWKPRRLGGGFGGKKNSGQLRFGGRIRNFKSPLNLIAFRKNRAHTSENKKPELPSLPSSSTKTYSNCVSTATTPSTISLPLTPPSQPPIVLPLTPPSHSNVLLPLTPPSNQIIVLPLTPPSQLSVNLPLTPPPSSSYIAHLPLTPPSNSNSSHPSS